MNLAKIKQDKTPLLYWVALLYEWVLAKANHRYAIWILMLICFVESIFFPIPPDVMLLPMMLARPKNSYLLALVAMLASILGGAVGYWTGWLFYDAIAAPLLQFYGYQDFYQTFQDLFLRYDYWIVFAGGFSPIPYKVITLSSGFVGMNFLGFMFVSLLARGMRFFLLAFLIQKFGSAIKDFLERYFALLTFLFCILLLGGFIFIKYFH